MITDDELDDLSDDDEVAFVQYETIVRASMERSRDSNNWAAERSYATHMIAFIEGRGMELSFTRPPDGDGVDFSEWFSGFLQRIDIAKVRLRLKHASRKKQHVKRPFSFAGF